MRRNDVKTCLCSVLTKNAESKVNQVSRGRTLSVSFRDVRAGTLDYYVDITFTGHSFLINLFGFGRITSGDCRQRFVISRALSRHLLGNRKEKALVRCILYKIKPSRLSMSKTTLVQSKSSTSHGFAKCQKHWLLNPAKS